MSDTKAGNVTLLHFLVDQVNLTGPEVVESLKRLRDILKKVTCMSQS